jgi:hypothetical protein
MRREYEKRRNRIVMILGRDVGDVLRPIPSAAGLHVSAWCVEAAPPPLWTAQCVT